jgi:DNA-binding NarL/FixJ family response regulator
MIQISSKVGPGQDVIATAATGKPAVKKVLAGQPYVTTSVPQPIGEKGVEDARSKQTDSLTGRQRQVLQLLGEGCTMKGVAGVLGLTPRTVAYHKYRIMRQFGIKNNMELLRLALKAHVVRSPQ